MKLLFIDHECHAATRSAEFFLNILKQQFVVETCYYSKAYKTGAERLMPSYDTAIIWEFPISRRNFFFSGKCNIFVPMYDNEWASKWQWKRIAWSGVGVISFCDKVSNHARKCGVRNILDVRYFPDPASLPQKCGDRKRVFLWERGGIDLTTAKVLFPPEKGYTFDIKHDSESLERYAYLNRLAKCGVVIAPRRKEGIGMSFLEAMAMGKCVVAHNDATMNEYISNEENGILFNADAPQAISVDTITHVLQNVASSAQKLRASWLSDSQKINSFIAAQRPCTPSLLANLKLATSYPLYLAEGAMNALRKIPMQKVI